jgi:tRNA A-37 threonylcarbamoyl transferase component Bud32
VADGDRVPVLLADRYELGEVIGRGGMSTVYRAVDTVLGREVAIKILTALEADPNALDRADSEIRTLASLNHRALVTLHDAGTAEFDGIESTYLVTELIDGPSLNERLRDGPLSDDEAAVLLAELSEALLVVHARGIVHRDVKPGNILLARPAVPDRPFDAKLADFGIAQLTGRATRLTAAGTILGTAAYLSPEQTRGLPATPAADIYSLGLVLLEALTGRPAFTGTLAETLAARLRAAPDVPGSLGYRWKSTLTAMTATDPVARPSARDLVARFEGDGSEEPTAALIASTAAVTAPTALLGAEPTVVLPAPGSDPAATAVLGAEPAATAVLPAGVRSPRPRSRRRVVVGAIVVACAGAAIAVGAAVGLMNGGHAPAADPVVTPTGAVPTSSATPPASVANSTTPAPSASPSSATVATSPSTTVGTSPSTTVGTSSSVGGGKGSAPNPGTGPGKPGDHGKPSGPGKPGGSGKGKVGK